MNKKIIGKNYMKKKIIIALTCLCLVGCGAKTTEEQMKELTDEYTLLSSKCEKTIFTDQILSDDCELMNKNYEEILTLFKNNNGDPSYIIDENNNMVDLFLNNNNANDISKKFALTLFDTFNRFYAAENEKYLLDNKKITTVSNLYNYSKRDDLKKLEQKIIVKTNQDKAAAEKKALEEKKAEQKRLAAEKKKKEDAAKKKKADRKKYLASFTKSPNYKKIARDPDKYFNKKFKINGEVLQVMSADSFGDVYARVALNNDVYKTVMIRVPENVYKTRLLEDDIVSIRATGYGEYTYTSTMNKEITIPQFEVVTYKIN